MGHMMRLVIICIVLGTLSSSSLSQTTTATTTPTTTTPTTSTTKETSTANPKTTTLTPEKECAQHNGSCDKCVSNAKCMYCNTDDSCQPYPSGKILPPSDVCALDKARWGVCWLNFEALIISVSVIGGVIILTIVSCCIYCCCCRGNNKKKYDKEDAKYESQRMERKMKQDERRTERKGRLDEIRRKYGLVKDDTPYQRFDA